MCKYGHFVGSPVRPIKSRAVVSRRVESCRITFRASLRSRSRQTKLELYEYESVEPQNTTHAHERRYTQYSHSHWHLDASCPKTTLCRKGKRLPGVDIYIIFRASHAPHRTHCNIPIVHTQSCGENSHLFRLTHVRSSGFYSSTACVFVYIVPMKLLQHSGVYLHVSRSLFIVRCNARRYYIAKHAAQTTAHTHTIESYSHVGRRNSRWLNVCEYV